MLKKGTFCLMIMLFCHSVSFSSEDLVHHIDKFPGSCVRGCVDFETPVSKGDSLKKCITLVNSLRFTIEKTLPTFFIIKSHCTKISWSLSDEPNTWKGYATIIKL